MPWPATSTQLCTPEDLAESLAGYLLSGEVVDAAEVWVLTCCVFHLAVASLLAQAAGVDTMRGCVNQASELRVKVAPPAASHTADDAWAPSAHLPA